MTRNLLNHFPSYNVDTLDYRHPTRLGPPVHDRAPGFGLSRSNPRTDPMSRQHPHQQQQSLSGSTSHPATVQSNSVASSPRRRISVACGRCRKRKIRCSGDPGDSTGCTNCKTAQLAPGSCLFLRVSSSAVNLSPSYSSSSPAISSATAPVTSHGLGLLHGSLSTPTLHSTLGHATPRNSLGLGPHGVGMGNGMIDSKPLYNAEMYDLTMASRPLYDIVGNDMSGPGDNSYSSFLLPGSHPSHGLSETSGGVGVLQSQPSEFSRPWHTIQSSGKTSGGSTSCYLESEPSSNISQIMSSAATYGPSPSNRISSGGISSSTSSSLDSYPIFPALSSLSNSLPEGGSRTDKILPPLPTRIQSLDFGSSSSIKAPPYNYVDSSGPSSTSQSRTSTSSHRSPTTNYAQTSPSMQIPGSQRSPTLLPPNSTSVGSVNSFITASATTSGTYSNTMVYSANRATLMDSSVDLMPLHTMLPQKSTHQHQHQRTDSEMSLQQYQSIPRSSAHPTAPPLRTSSSSGALSSYQQAGDQHRGNMGVNKVY